MIGVSTPDLKPCAHTGGPRVLRPVVLRPGRRVRPGRAAARAHPRWGALSGADARGSLVCTRASSVTEPCRASEPTTSTTSRAAPRCWGAAVAARSTTWRTRSGGRSDRRGARRPRRRPSRRGRWRSDLVGSTTVLEEKTPSGRELPGALAAVERWAGRRRRRGRGRADRWRHRAAAALTAHAAGLAARRRGPGRSGDAAHRPAVPVRRRAAGGHRGGGDVERLRIVVDTADPRDLETVWREACRTAAGGRPSRSAPSTPRC